MSSLIESESALGSGSADNQRKICCSTRVASFRRLRFSVSERARHGPEGQAPPLLRDRTECCCLPPKLNDPGSFCFCRVAWLQARRGDLIGIRGCAVCLWAWQLLELEALGPPHSLEFQRVRESPQRPGLPFPFYNVCVHCELWSSLMKTY